MATDALACVITKSPDADSIGPPGMETVDLRVPVPSGFTEYDPVWMNVVVCLPPKNTGVFTIPEIVKFPTPSALITPSPPELFAPEVEVNAYVPRILALDNASWARTPPLFSHGRLELNISPATNAKRVSVNCEDRLLLPKTNLYSFMFGPPSKFAPRTAEADRLSHVGISNHLVVDHHSPILVFQNVAVE